MAYPSQLTDTPSITDGYVLWPHWMQSIFAETLGWPIDKLFYVCFWTFTVVMFGCLVLAWCLRRRKTHRWPLRLFIVMLGIWPFFDTLWIGHEYKETCRAVAGIHIHKRVEADGYYSDLGSADGSGKAIYPKWQMYKIPVWGNHYNIGDAPGQFKFVEMRYYLKTPTDSTSKIKTLRLEWRDGQIMETIMDEPMARYKHRPILWTKKIGYGIWLKNDRIVDRTNQEVIARKVSNLTRTSWLWEKTRGLIGSGRECDEEYRSPIYPFDDNKNIIKNDGALTLEADLFKQPDGWGKSPDNFIAFVLKHHPHSIYKQAFPQ